MEIASGERNLSELRWSSLFAQNSIIRFFLTVHLGALGVGLVLTYFGLRNGTTIQSLFTRSGLLIIGPSILITILTKHKDFRHGCWMKTFENKKFSLWFDWRIISLLTGVVLSWLSVSSIPWIGNFITDGSPLLFLFPIDYIDLGFSLMRANIWTAQRQPIKRIIFLAIMSYAGSICVVTTLTWWVMPFWINGIGFLDCLAFGAICSCVDPNFCTKFLGLERPTTRSLHYSLVVEFVISYFLGSLLILCINYQRNCLVPWQCVISVMIYLLSGFVGNLLGQLYSYVWDNFTPIFLGENQRLLYEVSFGIWCFVLVAFSITTWVSYLDLSMVAITFSTTVVHLTNLQPLDRYNGISKYLDVGVYVRIGLFAFHKLHSWSVQPALLLVYITWFGRVPGVYIQRYLSGRAVTRSERNIIWLAGLVRGGYTLTLASTVFGAESNEINKVLMSTTITMVVATNFSIGLLSPWRVRFNFPVSRDQLINIDARRDA